jgi:hypothetical protein
VRLLLVASVRRHGDARFASVADAQGPGAETAPCSEVRPGQAGVVVITPNGFLNENCTPPGSKEGAGGAAVFHCSEIIEGEGVTGNALFTPSGHFAAHCTPSFVEPSSEPGSPE